MSSSSIGFFGACVKVFQHLRPQTHIGLRAAQVKGAAAAIDVDIEAVGELADVFIQRAAQVGQHQVVFGA